MELQIFHFNFCCICAIPPSNPFVIHTVLNNKMNTVMWANFGPWVQLCPTHEKVNEKVLTNFTNIRI